MQKFILFIALCICFNKAIAQAPIMDNSWMPQAGDNYYVYNLYGKTATLDSDTGANFTWDFNSVYGNYIGFPVDGYYFVLPDIASIPCSNGSANFATGNSDYYACYVKNNNGLFMTDYKFDTHNSNAGVEYISYSKLQYFMKNNLHFRESYRDTAKYFYKFSVDNPSDSPYRGIKYNYTKYDGYGKLKVSGREFDTAIRVFETNYQKDTTYADPIKNQFIANKIYLWYVPSIHVPVLSMVISWQIQIKGGINDTLERHDYINLSLLDPDGPPPPKIININNTNATFSNNNIIINGAKGANINYILYDAEGREIQKGKPETNGVSSFIATEHISAGMYFLKVLDNNGQKKTTKLVKEK